MAEREPLQVVLNVAVERRLHRRRHRYRAAVSQRTGAAVDQADAPGTVQAQRHVRDYRQRTVPLRADRALGTEEAENVLDGLLELLEIRLELDRVVLLDVGSIVYQVE